MLSKSMATNTAMYKKAMPAAAAVVCVSIDLSFLRKHSPRTMRVQILFFPES